MPYDVIIAGAGPVGLFLAIELATARVKPLVLEKLAEPSRAIKALSVGVVGAEALERRGLANALEREQQALKAVIAAMLKARFKEGVTKKPGGHFSALFVIDASLQRHPERAMRVVPQEALERILAARATELGIEVRRGIAIEGLEQHEDAVTVRTNEGVLRANYLVGCDGGRSSVRKLAGFDFVGTDPTLTGYQAVVELDRPEAIPAGWNRTPHGLITVMPGNRIFTAEFCGPPSDRNTPVQIAELEGSIQRVSGTSVKVMSMAMATRWTDNARQVPDYRRGRIFVAGDAAHVHSPFGGQGLNLGIVDAANLGFKLARAVRGDDRLLDSYNLERHPVAARVLENTRAQVALMRPDALTTALRSIVSDLIKLPEGNRYIGEMLTGVDIRYDLGDEDPEVGMLVEDQSLPLHDGSDARLYALMEAGGGLLVSPFERALPEGVQHARTLHGTSMLIRPDGCIAWTEASSHSLDSALGRWF